MLCSDDQKSVAIDEEAVFFSDGRGIDFLFDKLIASEACGIDKGDGLREVEVGEQGIGDMRFIGRADEGVAPPTSRVKPLGARDRGL